MPGHDVIVIAPDKFKGSLTATEVAEHIARGLRRKNGDLPVRLAPVADGGEGTLDAVLAHGYEAVPTVVTDPLDRRVPAAFGMRSHRAVIELAQASGLARMQDQAPAPLTASSRGTGELIRAALDAGCDEIVLGVGGSACTDGGAGMVAALGARLGDGRGRDIGPGGGALADIHTVDLSGLDPRLRDARIVLAGDVDNPLLGPTGAAAMFGPQKGADPGQVSTLERAMTRWADVVADATGIDASTWPGTGAAGGVGFAARAILGADMRPGVDLVLELIDFAEVLESARVVITGEGSLDEQSLHGKAPVGVAGAAARHDVPAIAVAGRCSLTIQQLQQSRFVASYALTTLEPDIAVCVQRAGQLLEQLASTITLPGRRETARHQ